MIVDADVLHGVFGAVICFTVEIGVLHLLARTACLWAKRISFSAPCNPVKSEPACGLLSYSEVGEVWGTPRK